MGRWQEAEDDDTSVNIVVQPGAVVNVRASQPETDSEAVARHRPKWVRTLIGIVSVLAGAASLAKAIWEAMH